MTFQDLVSLTSRLRNECPWDRAQTRKSLRPYLVEETSEVLDALDQGGPEEIKEELGDLLFQILFHAKLADELGEFDINGVIAHVTEKMIRRHPHVFNDAHAETPDDVRARWDVIKLTEEGKQRKSILDGVPKSMPSLLKAKKLQAKASKVGFDWKRVEDVFDKLNEELQEFQEAVKSGCIEHIEEELGDVLFVLVNISRFVKANPDDALNSTNRKFVERFHYIEQKASNLGLSLSEMSLKDMDALWDEAKKQVKQSDGINRTKRAK